MRILIAAAVSVGALIAVGVLGVAGAETTTTAAPAASVPPRTVAVQGVATAPVALEASAEAATAAYRQAMASAVADGQSKAKFLAEKAGATLGAVQSLEEGGGYIGCPEGIEYQGAQPDYGYASGGRVFAGASAPLARRMTAPTRRPPVAHRRKRKHPAKAAVATSCTLSTQVALSYQLD